MEGYAKPYVWNLVAKILRERFPEEFHTMPVEREVVVDLALTFAERFMQDEGFDPLKFLDQCSPNPDLYPFSELWEQNEQR